MRNMTILFLGLSILGTAAFADLNLPDRAVNFKIDDINTKGGNVAENAVRGVLAKALTSHILNSLQIVRFGSDATDRGLVFKARITQSQLSQLIDSLNSTATGAIASHLTISYPQDLDIE